MKKILVIEDEKKLIRILGDYFIAFMPNLFGDVVPRAYAELQGLVIEEFFKHESQDVVEIKTTVKAFYGGRLGADLPELSKNIFKAGDSLLILVSKQKEKKP